MKRVLLNLIAVMVVAINYIFCSYLLALLIAFVYSFRNHIYHTSPSYDFDWFILYGFGFILSLIIIGFLDVGSLVRIITNSRMPLTREKDKINPLIEEVLKIIDNFNIRNLRILVNDNFVANASSYGKNTIIIEKMLLTNYSDDEIKAVLLHELSHLINKDSLITLAIFWINIPLQIIMWLYEKYANICLYLIKGINQNFFNLILLIPLVVFLPLVALSFLGKFVLNITFMIISRLFEYQADRFVIEHGYQDGLISFLEKQLILEQRMSLIDKIMSNHPSIIKRIARLER